MSGLFTSRRLLGQVDLYGVTEMNRLIVQSDMLSVFINRFRSGVERFGGMKFVFK